MLRIFITYDNYQADAAKTPVSPTYFGLCHQQIGQLYKLQAEMCIYCDMRFGRVYPLHLIRTRPTRWREDDRAAAKSTRCKFQVDILLSLLPVEPIEVHIH